MSKRRYSKRKYSKRRVSKRRVSRKKNPKRKVSKRRSYKMKGGTRMAEMRRRAQAQAQAQAQEEMRRAQAEATQTQHVTEQSPAPAPAPSSAPASAPSEGVPPGGEQAGGPDPNSIQRLMEMGFNEATAIAALAETGGDVKAAANQLLTAEPSEGVPPGGGQAGEPGGQAGGPDPVQQLIEMGFNEATAIAALAANDGNVEAATNQLLTAEPSEGVPPGGGQAGGPDPVETLMGMGLGFSPEEVSAALDRVHGDVRLTSDRLYKKRQIMDIVTSLIKNYSGNLEGDLSDDIDHIWTSERWDRMRDGSLGVDTLSIESLIDLFLKRFGGLAWINVSPTDKATVRAKREVGTPGKDPATGDQMFYYQCPNCGGPVGISPRDEACQIIRHSPQEGDGAMDQHYGKGQGEEENPQIRQFINSRLATIQGKTILENYCYAPLLQENNDATGEKTIKIHPNGYNS